MELGNATGCHFLKSCQAEVVVSSVKHVSMFSCLLALAVDLFSTIGILPFSGGYARNMIEFVCFEFGPRFMFTVCSWLTPAVLFIFMNMTIIAILLSSGCLETRSKCDSDSDNEDDNPIAEQAYEQVETHEVRVHVNKSAFLSRSTSLGSNVPARTTTTTKTTTTGKVQKVPKKVKRQYSSPASVGRSRKTGDDKVQDPVTGSLPNSSPLSSYNLITCEQDVFNEIIERYIDKFRQDMRQQEVQSMVSGHIFASSCPKW